MSSSLDESFSLCWLFGLEASWVVFCLFFAGPLEAEDDERPSSQSSERLTSFCSFYKYFFLFKASAADHSASKACLGPSF